MKKIDSTIGTTEKALVSLMAHLVHLRIRKAGFKALGTPEELFEIPVVEFVRYISRQFRDGMSWDNRGELWELDHVQPLYLFDQSTLQDQQAAHRYTNWQPLLIPEHRLKTRLERRAKAQARAFNNLIFAILMEPYTPLPVKKVRVKLTAEEKKARQRAYYRKNRARIIESQKLSYYTRRDRIRKYWASISPEKRRERNARSRAWRARNKARVAANNRKWWANNPNAKWFYRNTGNTILAHTIRDRLRDKGLRPLGTPTQLLGMSPKQAAAYLERMFRPEWNWFNRGRLWQIAYIRPLRSFDLTTLAGQMEANHYKNLQAMPMKAYLMKQRRERRS